MIENVVLRVHQKANPYIRLLFSELWQTCNNELSKNIRVVTLYQTVLAFNVHNYSIHNLFKSISCDRYTSILMEPSEGKQMHLLNETNTTTIITHSIVFQYAHCINRIMG